MKNQCSVLFLIISLFACKEKAIPDVFSPQIDQLAQRYLELGRFSGTVLIAKEDNILFNQSYGFADYEKLIPFTDTTIFKIGTLTEFFTNQYYTEGKKGRMIQKFIEENCLENGLKHTFYQRESTATAQGYLYHNYRGQGIELQKAPHYNKEEPNFWAFGLKSTALDLLKYSYSLPDRTIQKDGFLEKDGFSYAFHKNKDLTIIILSNRRHPIGNEIVTAIQAIYKNGPYELPLLRMPFISNKELYAHYIGTYQVNPNFSFEVVTENDSLFTIMGNQQTPLIPQSDNQFYYQDFDAAIRFVRDSNQVITKAILYDGFLAGNEVEKIK